MDSAQGIVTEGGDALAAPGAKRVEPGRQRRCALPLDLGPIKDLYPSLMSQSDLEIAPEPTEMVKQKPPPKRVKAAC